MVRLRGFSLFLSPRNFIIFQMKFWEVLKSNKWRFQRFPPFLLTRLCFYFIFLPPDLKERKFISLSLLPPQPSPLPLSFILVRKFWHSSAARLHFFFRFFSPIEIIIIIIIKMIIVMVAKRLTKIVRKAEHPVAQAQNRYPRQFPHPFVRFGCAFLGASRLSSDQFEGLVHSILHGFRSSVRRAVGTSVRVRFFKCNACIGKCVSSSNEQIIICSWCNNELCEKFSSTTSSKSLFYLFIFAFDSRQVEYPKRIYNFEIHFPFFFFFFLSTRYLAK